MVTLNEKLEAVEVSLTAHDEGRLTDYELKKLSKVIDSVKTSDDDEEEE